MGVCMLDDHIRETSLSIILIYDHIEMIYVLYYYRVADYLKYTDCYRAINSDWDSCTAQFMSLVREEMNGNQSEDAKVLNLCW